MSTLGSLVVKFTADIKDLTSGMDRVMKSTSDMGKFAKTSFDVGAKALTAMGTAALAVGGNATRMAIDFESSFAGVKKTIDATDEEFRQLSGGLRAMAQEIPVNVNELNRIAESAGALGIAKESVVDFTRVISQMATTTNLTADAAANDFARISTIMGVSAQDFSRLGSTIVDLGNKGSTTESEITAMALRIVGAAKTVGMSSAEVAGLAASLSNVGIEAEMGGKAVSKIMIDMASNVASGGDKLAVFAKVAGMSADQFATAFKTNAASAIGDFIAGLGRIQQSGGNLFATLEELDVKEVRLRDTMLRTASAGDMVLKTLDTARAAWSENSALSAEAGKRYETTASQLQIFQNKLSDTQITLGTALLPVLLKVLEASQPLLVLIKNMADGFAALDPQAQMVIAGMTAFSAVFYPAVIALGSFTTAVKVLIPLVTSLWGIVAAHPFVLIGVAVAALAVAVVMNWDKIVKVIEGWATTVAAKVEAGLKGVVSAFSHANTVVTGIAKALAIGVEEFLVGKMLAIFNKVKGGIEEVKGYFKGLYEAVVGHSYIPDMVEEIGDHMRNLDVTMTAPARNAVVNTGRVFETGVMSWQSSINQFASTANQTWGTISSTFAGNLARMTDDTVNWGEMVKNTGLQVMTNLITMFLGIATQWVASLVMQDAAKATSDAAQVASHTAMETAKTAATAAGETSRMAISLATNKVIMAGVISTLAGVGAVGNAALATMQVVVMTVSSIMAGIGAALVAGVFTAPVGASMIAASGALMATGSASVAAGFGALQGALGAAITMASAAMATPFASGGIVTGATLGMMGEAGSEAAIPLNARGAKFMQSAFGMGGGTIQNNIYIDGKLMTKTVAKHLDSVIHTKLGYT